MASFDTLPYEILSHILTRAADLNSRDLVTYTYGLTQAPKPLQHVKIERYVRGRRPEDSLRWDSVNSIRQVSSRWRQWALSYGVKELYIRRWRGGERWLASGHLANTENPPSQAVYRQPYNALQETGNCFGSCPDLASNVHRLWFDGMYTVETTTDIFNVLSHCPNLKAVSMPWIALRYGTAEQWASLLHKESLSSLELMTINVTKSQLAPSARTVDYKVLEDPRINFSGLSKLKVFGNSNFKPVTDDDLRLIARTATNLEALHVTGISSASISGIIALVRASNETLRTLEYSPLSADGFEHPDPDPNRLTASMHCCPLLRCPRLSDLSVSVPTICPDMFSDPSRSTRWTGTLQVRASGLCTHTGPTGPCLREVLESARALMARRRDDDGEELGMEIFLGDYLFTPVSGSVHGNFETAHVLSEFTWPSPSPSPFSSPMRERESLDGGIDALALAPSRRGPYGQTGLYGKDEGPWARVSEEAFFEGVRKGWVTL